MHKARFDLVPWLVLVPAAGLVAAALVPMKVHAQTLDPGLASIALATAAGQSIYSAGSGGGHHQWDVAIGGSQARALGMGGAGLALKDSPVTRARRNPAVLSYQVRKFDFAWPTVGYHLDGAEYSDLRDWFDDAGNDGLDPDRLGSFARDFGARGVRMGIIGDAGLTVGHFYVGGGVDTLFQTRPNAALQEWSRNGADPLDLTGYERLDGYGFGSQVLQVGYGQFVPAPAGDVQQLSVGATLRFVRGYFSHHIADANDIEHGGGSMPGPEMDGDDVISDNGIGLDVGALLAGGPKKNTMVAAKINNLIEPRVSFAFAPPNDSGPSEGYYPFATKRFKPFRRSLELGVAHVTDDGTQLAADLVDAGNFLGQSEFRFGVEHPIGKMFKVRAGYADRGSFSFGFTVGNFHVAFSRDLPVAFNSAFRF